jgi:hypothetical protein
MRAVTNAIKTANDEIKTDADAEAEAAAYKEIHSGPQADRRVDLIKRVLDNVEDDED